MKWIFFGILAWTNGASAAAPVFRFNLMAEPHSMDPQTSVAASGNYVINNLYAGLMKYDDAKGLIPVGASHCRRLSGALECHLSARHLWSDGTPVTAEDYVRSFRRLIDPRNKSPQVELILSLKNAAAIWAGKKPLADLGVIAVDQKTLRFSFEKVDVDFEYKLTHPALAPMRFDHYPEKAKARELVVTGPYRIREWRTGDRIVMEPNPYFPGREGRPTVEALFVEDDSTALRLYEAGTLTFLRRLITAQIPVYRNRPDFHQIPMARFDYLGFSPALRDYPKLRRALSLSLDFENFRTLFDALGRPGCPSLPERLFHGPVCLTFQPAEAKRLIQDQPWPATLPKQLGFSQLGGDDIQRAAEWFQGQWSRQLHLLLELTSQEQNVYLNRLKTAPPPVFRKGIGLQRPTCLAALENFAPDSPENYIHLDSKKFREALGRLRTESRAVEAKRLCTAAIHALIDENWIIPLGEIHFSILASPKFAGWKLNSLNQLDLTGLQSADVK